MDELEALRRENAEQRRQLAQLVEQLARLNERVAELLAIAQRKQRKASAPVATLPLAPPVVEGEERRAFEERPKAPEKPQTERSAKKKAKPTGRKPLPKHLEAEEHELRPDSCAACGGYSLDVADCGWKRSSTSLKSTSAAASCAATPAAAGRAASALIGDNYFCAPVSNCR